MEDASTEKGRVTLSKTIKRLKRWSYFASPNMAKSSFFSDPKMDFPIQQDKGIESREKGACCFSSQKKHAQRE